MAAYPDKFDRADGSLGSGWTVDTGSISIAGEMAVAAGAANGHVTSGSESGNQDHFCVIPMGLASNQQQGILVKKASGSIDCYWALASEQDTYIQVATGYIYGGSRAGSGQGQIAKPAGNSYTLRVTWDGTGTHTFINGTPVGNMGYVDYPTNPQFGIIFGANGGTIAAFDDTDAPDQTIEVTPDPVWVGGGAVQMLCTGTGTEWTSGVPGSSTLSVDHGEVSDQWTADGTHIHFTYTPAEYVGTLTFTESQYSAQDTVNATLAPPETSGGEYCPFDAEFVALANASEKRTIDDRLMTENSVVIGFDYPFNNLTVPEALGEIWVALFHTGLVPEGDTTPLSLLATLWQILNGANDPAAGPYTPATSQPIKLDTEQILQRIKDIQTGADWTFYDLALLLGGSPVLNHGDLKRAIDEIDLSTITDLLYSMWGPQRPTLTDLAQLVNEMATVAGYTLGDVLDAIAALQLGVNVDLTPVMNRLNLIQPDTSISLSHLHADLATTDGVVDTMAASLSQVRGPGLITFQDILDAIAQLRHDISLDLSTLKLPPIWPGFAHVTLGTSVDLATVTNVDGPMHGCIVQITATEPGTSFMQYDGVKAWRHVGGLVFYDDHGQCETYQALGFGEALYVPKTMAVAQGVKLFKSHLPRGSITPWTINP